MKKQIKALLKPHYNKKIILSVSGGIDSMVLFSLLKELKYSLVVVHFNHQQREESEKEAKYIKELCGKFNISYEYFILNIDQDKNFQSESSKLRRNHLIEVAKKYKTDVIVTAHHLDDLAETIIMRLSRGSNLLGYAGMQPSYYKNNIYFIKPLLYVSKEDISLYAKENNVKYFIDHSNLETDYTRNKIRHNVIPYLKEDNVAFLNKIIDYNKSLSLTFQFLRNETIKFLKNKESFNVKEFSNLHLALKNDVIAFLLENHNVDITSVKIEAIIDFIETSGPNKAFTLKENLLLQKAYEKVFIQENKEPIVFKQELVFDKENNLINGDVIIINNNFNEIINNDDVLCYNRLVVPLYARTRKDGDLLYFPYGHKKLKDFYIDNKIPLNERNTDVLIVDKNDRVLAVLGRYYNNHPTLDRKTNVIYRRRKK